MLKNSQNGLFLPAEWGGRRTSADSNFAFCCLFFLRSSLDVLGFHPPFALGIDLDPPSRYPTQINTKHIKNTTRLRPKSSI